VHATRSPIHSQWSKGSRLSNDDKSRLRQATTSIIVGQFQINTLPQMSTKDKAKLKRGSVDPPPATSGANSTGGGSGTTGDGSGAATRLALLDCNYEEFHLPPDLAILQLDIVSFFMLPSANGTSR
jgi:hypothetical protein